MTAAVVFVTLWLPVHRHRQRLAGVHQLGEELRAIERAVAAAALEMEVAPGEPIPPEHWRPHLDARATRPALRQHGTDPFGRPYGPQPADRPVVLPEETRREWERRRQ